MIPLEIEVDQRLRPPLRAKRIEQLAILRGLLNDLDDLQIGAAGIAETLEIRTVNREHPRSLMDEKFVAARRAVQDAQCTADRRCQPARESAGADLMLVEIARAGQVFEDENVLV